MKLLTSCPECASVLEIEDTKPIHLESCIYCSACGFVVVISGLLAHKLAAAKDDYERKLVIDYIIAVRSNRNE